MSSHVIFVSSFYIRYSVPIDFMSFLNPCSDINQIFHYRVFQDGAIQLFAYTEQIDSGSK